jgi:hypothetical protein
MPLIFWIVLPVSAGLLLASEAVKGNCARGKPAIFLERAEAAKSHAPFAGRRDDVIRFSTLCYTEDRSRLCYYQ